MSYRNFTNEAEEGPDPSTSCVSAPAPSITPSITPSSTPSITPYPTFTKASLKSPVSDTNSPARRQDSLQVALGLVKRKEVVYIGSALTSLVLISVALFYLSQGGTQAGAPVLATTTAGPSQALGPPVLLYSEASFKYYKVPVVPGVRLIEGRVADTCDNHSMRAVCSGPSSCKYSNTSRCMVTPLSTNCNNPMFSLSKILCSGQKPRNCAAFEGVFSYMKSWYGGECGSVGTDWCANGDDYQSGTTQAGPGHELEEVETYYAYCAKQI